MNPEEVSKDCLKRIGWMASVSTNFDKEEYYERVAKKCIEDGHKVPTYGFLFLLEISEISRVVSHELVRHEQGFYKVQRSQRYIKEDGFNYTTPKSVENLLVYVPTLDINLHYDDLHDIVKRWYSGALEQGIKPEIARYALTNATHTKLHVAVNLEALMRFGNMRCCSLAQPEMQELAWEIKYAIAEVNPYLGSLIVPMCQKLGYCVDSRCCGKAETKKRIEELIEKGRMYEQLI
jgi:thymidylate synthase (FAD)